MLRNKVFNVNVLPDFSGKEISNRLTIQYKQPEEKTMLDVVDITTCKTSELRILEVLIINTIELNTATLKKRTNGYKSIQLKQKNQILTKDELYSGLMYANQIDVLKKKIVYLNQYLTNVRDLKEKSEACSG